MCVALLRLAREASLQGLCNANSVNSSYCGVKTGLTWFLLAEISQLQEVCSCKGLGQNEVNRIEGSE